MLDVLAKYASSMEKNSVELEKNCCKFAVVTSTDLENPARRRDRKKWQKMSRSHRQALELLSGGCVGSAAATVHDSLSQGKQQHGGTRGEVSSLPLVSGAGASVSRLAIDT